MTLWGPKVRRRAHKSSLLVPVMKQVNSVHTPQPIRLTSILVLSYHLRPRLPSVLFPSSSPTTILCCVYLTSPHACYIPVHLTHIAFITIIIFDEKYNYEDHFAIFSTFFSDSSKYRIYTRNTSNILTQSNLFTYFILTILSPLIRRKI
jgi:hypothetical protein